MKATMQNMIKAIRADELVGAGSCSSIDECMEDSDIEKELRGLGISTVDGAVAWARKGEELHLEQGLNCRWGEDDDPQLLDYREYKAKLDGKKGNPPDEMKGVYFTIDNGRVILSHETSSKLYDVVVTKPASVAFMVNGKPVNALPATSATRELMRVYHSSVVSIKKYLKGHSNDKWWELKRHLRSVIDKSYVGDAEQNPPDELERGPRKKRNPSHAKPPYKMAWSPACDACGTDISDRPDETLCAKCKQRVKEHAKKNPRSIDPDFDLRTEAPCERCGKPALGWETQVERGVHQLLCSDCARRVTRQAKKNPRIDINELTTNLRSGPERYKVEWPTANRLLINGYEFDVSAILLAASNVDEAADAIRARVDAEEDARWPGQFAPFMKKNPRARGGMKDWPAKFVAGYIEAALWTAEENFSSTDIEETTRAQMDADCMAFIAKNVGALASYDAAHAGHDFWLTRNGHGAGFWDGDYEEPEASQLTKAAKAFGTFDLYVGDDGLVYGVG